MNNWPFEKKSSSYNWDTAKQNTDPWAFKKPPSLHNWDTAKQCTDPWAFKKVPSSYNWDTAKQNTDPWFFEKQGIKLGYINNPYWQESAEFSDVHNPCGYWHKGDPGYTPYVPPPPASYTLYSCGKDDEYILGRSPVDNNIFLPMDDTSYFRTVSLGTGYGLYIKHDGTLWGLGSNSGGQLGTGSKEDILYTMTQIGTDTDWKVISASGALHTLAIKEDGSLWSCGDNTYGQLGLGDTTERLTFQRVGDDNDWKFVRCITYSSYAIKNNGDLYSWGHGVNGNLGHGDTQNYHVPTRVIVNGGGFDSITGGYYAAIGLKSGKIWSCGYNAYGQLCLDNTTSTNVFTVRTAYETWKVVDCGEKHTMLIKNNGALYGVGINAFGNLGLNHQNNVSVVTQIGTDKDWWQVQANGTYAFSFALKTNGSLYSCGSNYFGQLGLGLQENQGPIIFTEVGGTWGVVICGQLHSNIGKTL